MYRFGIVHSHSLKFQFKSRRIYVSKYKFSSCVCGLLKCVPTHCPAQNFNDWDGITNTKLDLAPYQGSSLEDIDEIFLLAKLQSSDRLLDIGCGDGRILIKAVQMGIAYAEGWELNKNIYELGQRHIQGVFQDSSDLDRCKIYFGDAMNSQPRDFDVIVMFLLERGYSAIDKWLKDEISHKNSSTRILTAGWPLPNWSIDKSIICKGGTRVYFYNITSKIN